MAQPVLSSDSEPQNVDEKGGIVHGGSDQNPDRNPIESIASDMLDSIRRGKSPLADAPKEIESEHQSELQGLLPLIERLEMARKSHIERPNGLASLGTDRPNRLGDFDLVRQIGRGGMGVVFEAIQRTLGRRVAVKVLPKSLLVDEVQLKRFQQEARTAASLHHTNIVPVFGVGEDQGFHYFVMQRIDGRGLDQIVSDSTSHRLSVDQVAKLGFQAASALSHAHSQNVLHRDIKPANLIVNERDELWVTDFGVAKAIESEAMTRTGDVVGTLRYMAPEQIMGLTDIRSDIYSLGVTLYELLAGRPAMDDASVRSAIVSRRPSPAPPPLRSLNPQVPRDLETILHTAMMSDPARRYASAADMADDLQRFTDGESISVHPETLLQSATRWSKRNPAIASLAALSLALLIGVAAISSVGYFRIQSALDSEHQSRTNAESTAELAVGALDQVFDRFASTDPSRSHFSSTPAISSEAAEMLEGLLPYFDALAARGNSHSDFREATLKARYSIGEIHFQLGDYQRSIDAMQLALIEAVSNGTSSAIWEAQIRNRIGYALRMLGEVEDAIEQHQLALDRLTQDTGQKLAGQKPAEQFEVARTHYLIAMRVVPGMRPGSMPPPVALNLRPPSGPPSGPPLGPPMGPPMGPPPGPPGGDNRRPNFDGPNFDGPNFDGPNFDGPNFDGPEFDGANFDGPELDGADFGQLPPTNSQSQVGHLNQALEVLRRLLKLEPDNIGYNVAFASCLRSMAGDSLSRRETEQQQYDQQSIDLLRRLNEEHPNEPFILIELVRALTGFTAFERFSPQTLQEASERCREAVKYCEMLVTSHPNVPDYNNELVHAYFRLGVLLDSTSNQNQDSASDREQNIDEYEKEAGDAFERAARHQAVLLRGHPDEVGYLAWYATMLMRSGEIALRDGDAEKCERAMKVSAKTWGRLCDEFPDEELPWEAAPFAFDLLSTAQQQLGKYEAANDSGTEAAMRRLYLDLRP